MKLTPGDPVLLMFPKENIKELNRRLRHYYQYHPIVNSIIDLHSSYSLSDFELKCDDKEIANYYNELKETWDLLTLMINMNRDYWLLGNAYLYGNWDENNLEWSSFNQYPPENIDLHRTYVGSGTVAFLKPDEELKRIISSGKDVDRAITELIPAEFTETMRSGKPFLLANSRLIHFARRPSAYALLGESAVKPILKDLLYEDKLRLLQYTFVDRSMFPIKHWKVGSKEKGWIPSKKHFDALEQQLIAAANDPDFNLITHPYVDVQFQSANALRADLKPEFEFTAKRIMMGLFASENMLTGGEASPYATSALNMKVVMHRYLMNRTSLERLLREKMFLPIAKAKGFIKRTQAELAHKVYTTKDVYHLPKFFYSQRLNLMSSTAEQDMLLKLRDKGEIPFELICDVFGWDKENLKSMFANEEGTIIDPAVKEARKAVAKESPEVRNKLIKGDKMKDMDLPTEKAPASPGRPAKPGDELIKAPTSNIAPGPGDKSPRAKQQDMGSMPSPKEIKEPAPPAPATPAPEAPIV